MNPGGGIPGGAPAPVVHVVVAGEVGGAERMVLRLARAAHSTGASGDAAAGAAPPRRHLIALWTDAAAVRALYTDAGVEVRTPPAATGRASRAMSRLMGATGGRDVAWLAALLRDSGAAAVQLHTFASHVLGTRAALQARVPMIRTEHSTRVYDHWLCRPFSGWSLRHASTVVAVSEHLGDIIRARVPAVAARVQVIRNGVPSPTSRATATWTVTSPSPSPSHAGRDDGPLRLGLVARLEPRKGVDRALAALARVPGPVLDIVGDGPQRAALERQTAALGLRGRVRFWGYRADPEAVLAHTDAVLCSSRTEGMPVALLEAMALGRPVIAVPVGGVPEIVTGGETGWLARDPSVGALAAALADAVALGRGEMARRGARARAAVQSRFTEQRMRDAYEALYRSLTRAVPAVTAASARAVRSAPAASWRSRA